MSADKFVAGAAWTTHPNTAESDAMPQVLHDVRVIAADCSFDGIVQVMADAPDTAIDRVQAMPIEEVRAMLKPIPSPVRQRRACP